MTNIARRMIDKSDALMFAPAPFDGRRFSNASGRNAQGGLSVLRWMLSRKRQPWPSFVPVGPVDKPAERVDDQTVQVTVVGHSTTLIQVAGLNILTDPMFSETAGPFPWIGVRRVQAPALTLEDLPRIDLILLSHNHYDHLDQRSLRALAQRYNPVLLTGIGVGRSTPPANVFELNWWETRAVARDIRVTYVPAEHFSARGPFDRNKSLWGGFVIETRLGAIYFAGDTAAGDHFTLIRERFGPIALALLPIGAYEPRWFMQVVHMNPEEAVAAYVALEARAAIAIHHGAFRLTDEAINAPIDELRSAIGRRAAETIDFRTPSAGIRTIIKMGALCAMS